MTSYAVGDDGYFQAGNPRGGAAQATRFIDNGNGTISDRATGLQWVKQPELIIPGATGVYSTNQIQVAHGNWATSHAYALAELVADGDGSQSPALTIATISNATLGEATVSAGHNLSSGQRIIITGCTGSASWIAMNGTARTVTVTGATTFTFGVNTTAYGAYDANSGTAKQVKYYVCSTAHTSGTFADDIAAAKWRQTVWTASAADLLTPATMVWPNAEGYALGSKWDGVNPLGAVGLTYAGFADWRLPNIMELYGITDKGRQPCGIDPTAFPNTVGSFYHSSTTRLANTLHNYNVYFGSTPYINYVLKTTASWYVRPVRGGRLNANG